MRSHSLRDRCRSIAMLNCHCSDRLCTRRSQLAQIHQARRGGLSVPHTGPPARMGLVFAETQDNWMLHSIRHRRVWLSSGRVRKVRVVWATKDHVIRNRSVAVVNPVWSAVIVRKQLKIRHRETMTNIECHRINRFALGVVIINCLLKYLLNLILRWPWKPLTKEVPPPQSASR